VKRERYEMYDSVHLKIKLTLPSSFLFNAINRLNADKT